MTGQCTRLPANRCCQGTFTIETSSKSLSAPQSRRDRTTAVMALRRLGMSRAVAFSMVSQIWSGMAGPVTMLVIAHWMSAVAQGFYYTFGSVLALQVFVELGLATVLVQVASHEWAFLCRDASGGIQGDARAFSRLASLLRFALKWYVLAGFLVAIGLGLGGSLFFLAKPAQGVAWQAPWLWLCGIAGAALMMSPFFSIIEGSNEVASIYSFRLIQGVLNSAVLIVCIISGCGLYSLPAAALCRLTCGIIFITWKHRDFVHQLLAHTAREYISWSTEVWPFQWRIGVSWLSGYFIFSFFTPVMFYYHGPKVAGQMGMTLSLTAAIELMAYPWVSTRVPQFGMLIARKRFTELDRLFTRLFYLAMGIVTAGAVAIFGGVWTLTSAKASLAERLLPLTPIVLLLGQRVLNCAVGVMAFYLRAHKKEPLMIPSLISAVLMGLSTWMLGAKYGAGGAAMGFLLVTLLWSFPSCYYIFRHCREVWHA